jgi:catechol 2,3-dioxygenase-like lactoylglutathione lyase family enzyme
MSADAGYRIDHIALLVRDLEESARFYTEVIGINEIPNPMGGTLIRWFEIGHHQRIHMQAGDVSRTFVEKQTHIALAARDFDSVLQRLRTQGAAFSDMKGTLGAVNLRPDGMRAVFLQDPNGYWIEINDFPQPE